MVEVGPRSSLAAGEVGAARPCLQQYSSLCVSVSHPSRVHPLHNHCKAASSSNGLPEAADRQLLLRMLFQKGC